MSLSPPSDDPGVMHRLPLRGPVLFAVRFGWVLLAALSLGGFLLSIPYHIIQLSSELTIETKIALYQLGRSADFYIYYGLAHAVIIAVGYSLTAVAIFLNRSDDWMTIFVSLALQTFGVAISPSPEMVPILFSLAEYNPPFGLPVLALYALGIGSILLVFYLFPDGHFVPRWTRPAAYIWLVWLLIFVLAPIHGETTLQIPASLQYLLGLVSLDPQGFVRLFQSLRLYGMLVVVLAWFGSGIFAQIYRYLRVSSPLQRQQTKWVVFGFSASVLLYFGAYLPVPIMIDLGVANTTIVRYHLIALPVETFALLLFPLALSVSMLRYRLWEIDFLINRTLVYGALTGSLAALYFGVVLLIQAIFRQVSGYDSTLLIAMTTLGVAALFRPLRNRVQTVIDRRFYREKVNFRQAFTDFARQVRTILSLPELLQVLVDRTTELLHVEYGAVFFLQPGGAWGLAHAHQLPPDTNPTLTLTERQLERLKAGQAVSLPRAPLFTMLIPLISPRSSDRSAQTPPLSGVLALGPLRSGLHYSREDQVLLLGLADQAGTALYVARLIQETQAEMARREEAEHRLEIYRNSPIGRAESAAQDLLRRPEAAFSELHQLAQQAGKDPQAAALLGNLSKALDNLEGGPLVGLAEGFHYLHSSQFSAELLPLGLRTLTTALENLLQCLPLEGDTTRAEIESFQGINALYRLCQMAYEANSIAQITELRLPLTAAPQQATLPCLEGLAQGLAELAKAAEALYAYERVDTSSDKMAYLARTVHHLRHVDHLARTELGTADRPSIQRISESWMALVTGAMTGLQTSAHIVCQLLTRNTWQGDVVTLTLNLLNQGKGAAFGIQVALNSSPEYTLVDESARLDRLGPGEEAQVQLRMRPRLEPSCDHFRARFVILYADPRGPDQVENFADEVHILAEQSSFAFIPNPYVVGTPLQTGSPLFFGREDIVRFIQDNLEASHRNNLVLIGQRRTGKTSLLKQLPARLDDSHLSVYLDGQTLGLDPGLANFFLTLATEISFALEDRGFAIDPPDPAQFQDRPAHAFEQVFLAQVRACIGERHLLLLLDEFEELEAAVRRGSLDPSIFGFLRHLVQHVSNLSVIFCGTHRIEQLAADYWNVLFNISLYQHIAFLDKEEAMRLIQEPVAPYGMHYDDLALEKMWRVTAGHPYFLQLLCHSLVNRHNKAHRSYITIADVNAALDEILASGEAHFVYLWAESTPVERLTLTALSRMVPLNGQATAVQVLDYLTERGISIERQAVSEALHHLNLRDILRANRESDADGEAYRWRLGLLGLWVEKYKSLSRVVDEVAL